MAIVAETVELIEGKRDQIKTWFLNPAFEMFLSSLAGEEADILVKALDLITESKNPTKGDTALGDQESILLMKAAKLRLVRTTLVEFSSKERKLWQTKLYVE